MGAIPHPAGRLIHAPVTPQGIDHQVLLGAMHMIKSAVGTRSFLPALTGVKLTRSDVGATIEATDLECSIRVDIAGGATDGETFVLPYKIAMQALSQMGPGTVTLELSGGELTAPAREEPCSWCSGTGKIDDEDERGQSFKVDCDNCEGKGNVTIPEQRSPGKARLVCGSKAYEFRTLPAEDFLEIPEPGPATAVVSTHGLREAIDVAFASSVDEARPILTGILFDWNVEQGSVTLVATDSYRLGIATAGPVVYHDIGDITQGTHIRPIVVPSSRLRQLAKLLEGQKDVGLSFTHSAMSVHVGPLTWTSRLIDGEFPNWQQLVPEGDQPGVLTAAPDELLAAIKGVGLLAQSGTPVRLELGPEVRLTAGTQDVGEASETIQARYEGEPVTVGFNPEYLASCIRFASDGEQVQLGIRDAMKPALLTGRPGRTGLLMPVRIS